MNIIQELEELYDEIDSSYADQEYEANRKGYNRKEASIKNKRSINDHSYFLMAFTRMEDRVKTLAKKLIQDKSNNLSSWSYKRVWGIIKKREDDDSLYFMEYVELLTEKGDSDYTKIRQYYDNRNEVAHGGYLESIDMDKVFTDFKKIYRDLA